MTVIVAARRHGGTHLINPLVGQLSGEKVKSADKARSLYVPEGKLVCFIRDPRNTLISNYRWHLRKKGLDASPPPNFGADAILAGMLTRKRINPKDPPEWQGLHGMHFEHAYWAYWTSFEDKFIVRFEDLTSEETGPWWAKMIGEYLGSKENSEAIFRSLFRQSPTYTGRFTNWKEWFGPKTTEAFYSNEVGGAYLLKFLGIRHEAN